MENRQSWLLLVLSLSGQQATLRMRVWRALKASGAAVLRDGVYLLPATPEHQQTLQVQADAVATAGGNAYLVEFDGSADDNEVFQALFDRVAEYDILLKQVEAFVAAIGQADETAARRQLNQLQRQFQSITATDYFPGTSQARATQALIDAEAAFNRCFSPDEPTAAPGTVERRDPAQYRGRQWATRAHLWVDRVASAWLIRRFIDPEARFLWLTDPANCPSDVLGFDFDGAAFTHVGNRVTFEVLLESFGLTDPALSAIAAIVHYLDVGGVPVPEAAGFAAILTGTRARLPDDDRFLAETSKLLDDLYLSHTQPSAR